MENNSDLDDEGSGLELVHVSDVLDYLGEHGLFHTGHLVLFELFQEFLTLMQESRQETTYYIQQQQQQKHSNTQTVITMIHSIKILFT